jgi:hypothetical protein
MNVRTQITLDPETQRRAQARAEQLGISFAEYVRRLMASDLGEPQARPDISVVFDLIDEGRATNIAHDKDEMIAQAVWQEHVRKTGRKRRTSMRVKASRR